MGRVIYKVSIHLGTTKVQETSCIGAFGSRMYTKELVRAMGRFGYNTMRQDEPTTQVGGNVSGSSLNCNCMELLRMLP